MKFGKIALMLMLVLALSCVMAGCPGEAPPTGTTTTTTTTSTTTGGGGGGGGPLPPPQTGPGTLLYTPLTDTTCTLSGYTGSFEGGVVTVPAKQTIAGKEYEVVKIDAGALRGCTTVTEVVVPDSVAEIGLGAFEGCTGLTKITVPYVGGSASANGHIGYIFGAAAFSQNATYVPASLATVVIGDSCTSISPFAFDSCAGITDIRLGSSVASIGAYAFAHTGLTAPVLPASVQSIGRGIFAYCDISELTLPFVGADRTAEIGYIGYLFGATSYTDSSSHVTSALAALRSVTLVNGNGANETCTVLGAGAFYGCTSLATPNLPTTIVNIGRDAFTGTPYYAGWHDGPVYIGAEGSKILYTFKGEMTDTSVTVAEGTISIAAGAFAGTPLTSITLPSTLTYIGAGAFEGTALTSITLPFVGESATSPNSYLGFIFGAASLAENGSALPATLKAVILGDACTAVADSAFYGCTGLTSVTIGKNVTRVAKNAFVGCTSLTTIAVAAENTAYRVAGGLLYNAAGNDLIAVPMAIAGDITLLDITRIDAEQFKGCVNITSITLPATLESIGKNAFDGCTALASFGSFPASLAKVEYEAFKNTAWYTAQANGAVYAGNVLYRIKGALSEITIPSGIIYVTERAFEESNATVISLPASIREVGPAIFRDCRNITALTLPFIGLSANGDTGNYLGYMFGAASTAYVAPYLPTNLTSVTLLDGCTQLREYAFVGCATLSEINFADTITYVAKNALDGTAFMANLAANPSGEVFYIANIAFRYFPVAGSRNNEVTLRQGTVAIAEGAFEGITNLMSLRMPDSVTYIGKNAFLACTHLLNVRMSSNLVTLSEGAFRDCTALTSIYVSKTVKVIGRQAFSGCTSMTVLHLEYGLEKIEDSAFANCYELADIRSVYFWANDGFGHTKWLAIEVAAGNSIVASASKEYMETFYENIAIGDPFPEVE